MISATALIGCGDEEVLPEDEKQDGAVESLSISKNENADDNSLFATIYCKLSTTDGPLSTYTTYFKYDETTVNYPSETDIKHAILLENPFNLEHWARAQGKYRLIDVSIEIPTAAAKSAFKPDAKNMYYMAGHSWHFLNLSLSQKAVGQNLAISRRGFFLWRAHRA